MDSFANKHSNASNVNEALHAVSPLLSAIMTGILILGTCALMVRYVYNDYTAYLALGPGGTPSTFPGYMKISFLSMFRLGDPLSHIVVPGNLVGTGFLDASSVPTRPYERPKVAGIAPHRQTNQFPSEEIHAMLDARIMEFTKSSPGHFHVTTSAFEKHCPGLFVNKKADPECNGEICHAHPSDGSMHMTLHPEDINTIIAAGWGGEIFALLVTPLQLMLIVIVRASPSCPWWLLHPLRAEGVHDDLRPADQG